MNRSTTGAPTRGGGNKVATARPTDFVRSVFLELRRVTWPSQEEWISATILTVALVVGIGVFTYLVDLLLTWVFNIIRPV